MHYVENFFSLIGDLTWGHSLIPLLVVLGLFITLMTGFVQIEFFKRMFSVLSPKGQNADPNTITARSALLISVGGRVGGGNIAGVAVAITLGGPGAVFWMWAIAFVGMATSLVECTLAQVFKRRQADGAFRGGPARVILHGLGQNYRWLAIVYAVCLVAAFGIGFNAFQGNTVAGAVEDSLGISRLVTGSLLSVIAGFIVFGGIRRIAKVSDVVVPVMACCYILMTLFIVAINITELPEILWSIIANAFGLEEAVSGGIGAAIANGMRRGLFSNEAGLGSAPNIAATAEVHHPVSQGITQAFSVFIDTFLICSCTAFVILLGDVYVPGAEGMDGIALTQQSLASHLGAWAQYFLTFMILLFAFSSIIYNYYLGENALTVITKSPLALNVLRVVIIGIVFLGATASGATSVFFFSDPLMGVLAVVNLVVIMMLLPVCLRIIKDFREQLKAGVERPVFNPQDFSDLDLDIRAWNGVATKRTAASDELANSTLATK